MGNAFAEIAFTQGVRELQIQAGSRERYAAMEESANRRDKLTERETTFIESRDHFFQASVSETGWPYVQHRGGPAGFLKVLDERTLGFADYRGNVQYVSVGNLIHDNRVALILMDYANQRRLKLLGRVRFIDRDTEPDLIERLVTPGYKAIVERGFIISVKAFDWNCPQHITPRFTLAEIDEMTAPLRAQLRRNE
ncbi:MULTISPECIES: pyridoxamine 5'-phosphate oxidase family protein [unclassified Limnobacter]|jgi:predicted pyridoxine 5'-phosphate oxidase superfamily flavin-nucleotide-binding protein|uniref:pyridoxamine 5'-phosphate oxidase family protein n=1 Tax=unclassified Limnobacter TaxID=2630203 RepID=UPI000C400BAA|nr:MULTISPECIES: pyridoxamine 5'-phosphate oxidase family protein [unclassified Limnobacter]MAG80649.1 pyridoxamine 5-phosphate oxidase [Sutterellaceae bacterium]MBT83303.1 pyridoxamine 5-phosphate oxidase [Sutterellaceae bacterium]|tara:strand:- start:3878 stop:4462 length:585 start_codon:yes stop_codon:yes gene_type:complete